MPAPVAGVVGQPGALPDKEEATDAPPSADALDLVIVPAVVVLPESDRAEAGPVTVAEAGRVAVAVRALEPAVPREVEAPGTAAVGMEMPEEEATDETLPSPSPVHRPFSRSR